MDQNQALAKLQAAFPDYRSNVSIERDIAWFTHPNIVWFHLGTGVPCLGYPSFDHVDQAIAFFKGLSFVKVPSR